MTIYSRHVKLDYHVLASFYIFSGTMSFIRRSSLSAVTPLNNNNNNNNINNNNNKIFI